MVRWWAGLTTMPRQRISKGCCGSTSPNVSIGAGRPPPQAGNLGKLRRPSPTHTSTGCAPNVPTSVCSVRSPQQGQALTLSHVYVPALIAPPPEPVVPTADKRRRKRKTQPEETAERKPI